MNTVEIILKESGSNAEVNIDFRLFQHSYNNKLIDIYVPISLLYTNNQNTFITAVKTGSISLDTNGRRITSDSHYASYIKDQIIDGKAYAVYEQQMPKEYTEYAGTTTIVANVINIDNDSNRVIDVITTQETQIQVLPSEYIGDEEIVEPTDLERLYGLLDLKQDKEDENISNQKILQNAQHKVVNALNDLNDQVFENTETISSQGNSISNLSQRVQNIERQLTPIGQMNLTALPTNQQLNAYVYSIVQRQPELNDVITVVVNDDGVITNYRYLYSLAGWTHYQIEYQQKAENDTAGLIEGTEGISGYSQPINADIVNGQIINLKYKNANNTYEQVAGRLNTNTQAIEDIINGTQVVGEAQRSQKDANGNTITTTYARASNVYTKGESDNRYMPKSYINIYYYSAEGLVDNVPTTPADGVQFSGNIPVSGEIQLASCGRTLEASYHFTKNTVDQSKIWLVADENTTLQFRLLTYVTHNGQSKLLSSQITGDVQFVADEIREVAFESIYNNLGNEEIDVASGETFTKILYVQASDNTESTIELISSQQYASSFNFQVQASVESQDVVWVIPEVTPYIDILEYFNQGKEVLMNIGNQVFRLARTYSTQTNQYIEFDYFDQTYRAWAFVDNENHWGSGCVPILTTQSVNTQIQNALEPLQFYSAVIKLKVADWVNGSQTKNISVVDANSMVWVSPAPNGNTGDDFMSAGIYVGGQGSGTLTFSATQTPLTDIDVKVIINNALSGNLQVDDALYINQTQENVSQVDDTLNIGGN